MAKITSIEFAERVSQRSAEEAESEQHGCTYALIDFLEKLGKTHPGAVGLASLTFGVPCVMVITASTNDSGAERIHGSLVAPSCMRVFAKVIANLPHELRNAFEIQLNLEKEAAALRAKIKSINEQYDAAAFDGEASVDNHHQPAEGATP